MSSAAICHLIIRYNKGLISKTAWRSCILPCCIYTAPYVMLGAPQLIQMFHVTPHNCPRLHLQMSNPPNYSMLSAMLCTPHRPVTDRTSRQHLMARVCHAEHPPASIKGAHHQPLLAQAGSVATTTCRNQHVDSTPHDLAIHRTGNAAHYAAHLLNSPRLNTHQDPKR